MVVLVRGAFPALTSFGFRFLTGVNWDAAAGFGALPYILGTLVTALIAIAIGVPISLGIAIFLAEMAPDVIRVVVSNIVELLAAVPSIIYGLWGLYVLRIWVANYVQAPIQGSFGFLPIFGGTSYDLNFLTAGLILAIMIIPTIASISREVMVSVPTSQREAAYSVGATRWEVVRMSVHSYLSGESSKFKQGLSSKNVKLFDTTIQGQTRSVARSTMRRARHDTANQH